MCEPMLSVVRLLLWVLVALMPLQGFAAASMLCCLARPAHELVMTSDGSVGAGSAPLAVDARGHKLDSARLDEPLLRGGDEERHGCGVCASLCHAIALTGAAATVKVTLPLGQTPRQDQPLVTTRPFPVPDKPPRA